MSQSSENAIWARGLQKIFHGKVAVRNLSLDVRRGEVVGLLGANGAGKSTSVKILLGLVFPNRGRAEILGRPAGDLETRAKIGFLPEHFRFYDWLTPTELLELHGRLYGMSQGALRTRIPGLLDLVGLTQHREKRLRDFSKGMLQRIGLAQALLNEPELIFLDEPTSGLDPVGRRLVRDIIKAQRERGAAVLLNSHLLSEVEITCDRVAFMKDGEVVETRELNSEFAGQSISILADEVTADCLNGLSQWASAIRQQGRRLTLSVSTEKLVPVVISYLVEKGARLHEVTRERLSLEERFLEIVGSDGGL